MSDNKKLFLSAVSNEFSGYRELLAQDLQRPTLDVKDQQQIERLTTGGTTLEKLDTYIQSCQGVIHLIGKATGSIPEELAVAKIKAKYPDLAERLPPLAAPLGQSQPGFSYTQWEAYLAIYHRRELFVYRPTDFELDALQVPRGPDFQLDAAQLANQKTHFKRICDLGHDRGQFLNEERLSSAVLRDLVEILPRLEANIPVSATRLSHTAARLIGRDAELTQLDQAWNNSQKNVVVIRAFGGMGKTSMVATWMAELALKGWRGAERVFDWSFYSQGTKDQAAASSDTFIAAALRTFGDPDPTLGSPWDRGARLAQLVGAQRCLLVLDGVEPLQYPPGPMKGQFKDQAIEALLKGLCAQNAGLCVVTSREKVVDIQQHYGRTADDVELTELSDLAGAALLHYAGATRAGARDGIEPDEPELQLASREVRGHGLTLQLLGQYLRLVEDGDILKRDTVRLAEAEKEYKNDADRPYGHAFKAMEAYEKWFQTGGESEQRQLAALRLLGLFDRPASADCLKALRAEPAIEGLTEPLMGLTDRGWKLTLNRLAEINLLAVQPDGSVDAHPLLREYFAMRLRGTGFQPVSQDNHGLEGRATSEVWRAAHRRLYEHLCETTNEGDQPTLEQLQPLYQAVAHGCHAGLVENALTNLIIPRIWKGTGADGFYSSKKLGAFGSDLGALACFFEIPWNKMNSALSMELQSSLVSVVAFRLRALGRLTESLEPMRAGLQTVVELEVWKNAAARASNLSELELTLGEVSGALSDAERSVTYADRSGDAFQRMAFRTTHADALHQSGRRSEAESLFREAEQMQAERQPAYPLLYSVQGFQYCDLLLAPAEREAWRVVFRGTGFQPVNEQGSHGQHGRATLKIRKGAYLPHWTHEGGIYAVTFRLVDSLPASIVDAWKHEREDISARAKRQGRKLTTAESKRLQELFSEKVENHLDAGVGACWMKQPKIARIVRDALLHFDGQRYRLIAWCVMPNHSSRERGSGVCSAGTQVPTAQRATWTKPGRLPPAARCRCSWPTSISIEHGCSAGMSPRR